MRKRLLTAALALGLLSSSALALTLGTVVLFRMKKDRYAWVTVVPTVWLLACTLTAGWMKLFSADPRVGFVATARKFSAEVARHQAEGTLPEKGPTIEQMQQIGVGLGGHHHQHPIPQAGNLLQYFNKAVGFTQQIIFKFGHG